MLRKIRIVLALFFFTFITLLFLDFTGTIHHWFDWMAKVQLVPAILAVNVGVIIFIVLLTLIFGRIYCSVICPLGVFQDTVSWTRGKFKKNRFSFSPAKSWLRYGVLVVFVVCLIIGISALVSILEPYSAYGRIASNLFNPIWRAGNNVLAIIAERMDSYAFYSVDIWIKSGITLLTAVITFFVVAVLAWLNGRTYCNTVCPVGTILGFFSRFSLLKPVFNEQKCNSCGLCSRNCKASCINSKEKKIDYSRCVSCMDCIAKCNKGAIDYKIDGNMIRSKKQTENMTDNLIEEKGSSRRDFLAVTGMLAISTALKAQSEVADGGFAFIEDKKAPKRSTSIVPPGAVSSRNMNQHCTACQLCVSACPNNILRPSNELSKFMQPEISYERGYCRPECTRCSEVCPTGAIKRIDTADKSALQIGRAFWVKENCVVLRDEVQCTSCERHCPTGAIQLISINPSDKESLKTPAVDIERCIGCGACENLCPARPYSAIYVEGNVTHRTI